MTRIYFVTPDGDVGFREQPSQVPPDAQTIDQQIHDNIIAAKVAGQHVRVVDGEIVLNFKRFYVTAEGEPHKYFDTGDVPGGSLEVSEEEHNAAHDARMSGKNVRVIDGVLDLDWQEPEEEEPEPEEPTPPDPLRPLEPDQFHAMLILTGHRQDIDLMLSNAMDPEHDDYDPIFGAYALARLEKAKWFDINDPLVTTLASAIGLDEETLQSLWISAHDMFGNPAT